MSRAIPLARRAARPNPIEIVLARAPLSPRRRRVNVRLPTQAAPDARTHPMLVVFPHTYLQGSLAPDVER